MLALGGVTAWSWTRATAAAQSAPVEAVDTGPTVAELHALLTTTPAVEKTVPAPVRVVDHFRSWSKAVRDGLRESEYAALATGVAAETLLDVRKRYRLTGID